MNSSGISSLDTLLGGGYPKGIICISGPRGSGKTQLLLAAAQAALVNDTPVVFFSFDTDIREILADTSSDLSKVYCRIHTLDEAVNRLRGYNSKTLVLMDGIHKAFVHRGPDDTGIVEDGGVALKARWFNSQVSTLRRLSNVILTSENVLHYSALTRATSTAIELRVSNNYSSHELTVTKSRTSTTATGSSIPLVLRGHGKVLPMEILSRFNRF